MSVLNDRVMFLPLLALADATSQNWEYCELFSPAFATISHFCAEVEVEVHLTLVSFD
jgi:hypothetical protein